MSRARRTAAAAVSALAAIAVVGGSRLPWTASPADRALLRLSWRAPSEATERCRPLTQEEKADLPVHMRVPEVCETRTVPYLLEIRIDGAAAAHDTLHGAGAREDRPVVVFREIPLVSGSHDVEVRFRPIPEPGATPTGQGESHEGDEEEREHREEADEEEETEEADEEEEDRERRAISLTYAERLELAPRAVALLTLDRERRQIVRVAAP